ncbi:MAG: DUF4397 domain-containing protein [bacterium]
MRLQRMTIFALTLLAITTTTAFGQTADVQIIHNSPDPGASSVDIYLNTDLAVPDFGFREATGMTPLPAGSEIQIGVAPGNSMSSADVLAWFPVTLTPGATYVVMAAGVLDEMLPGNPDGRATGFNLYINELVTSGPGDQVGILAFHGAPDAPSVNIDAVGVGTLFGDLPFNEFDGYLFVPADDYKLEIKPAANPGSVVATFSAPLSGLGGGTAVVFASGFLTSKLEEFGLFAALGDGTVLQLAPTTVDNEMASWGGLKAMYGN